MQRNPAQNIGNFGTIVRHNISHNDRNRIFHMSAVEHTLVEDNAIYVGRGLDVQMLLDSNWFGWTDVEALFGRRPEPFDLSPVLLLTLLEQPQSFSHHLAGVTEASGLHARLNKTVKVLCEIYVAGRHPCSGNYCQS